MNIRPLVNCNKSFFNYLRSKPLVAAAATTCVLGAVAAIVSLGAHVLYSQVSEGSKFSDLSDVSDLISRIDQSTSISEQGESFTRLFAEAIKSCPATESLGKDYFSINGAGQPELNAQQFDASYKARAQQYACQLEKFAALRHHFTKLANMSFDSSTLFVPQPLELKGAFRTPMLDFNNQGLAINNQGLANRIAQAINHWYPDQNITVTSIEYAAPDNLGRGNSIQPVFHTDQIKGDKELKMAVLTIPAEEAYVGIGSVWITRSGKKVQRVYVDGSNNPWDTWKESCPKEPLHIFGRDMATNKVDIYPLDQLLHPECYSTMTTQIVPGLVVANPGYELLSPELPDYDLLGDELRNEGFEEKTGKMLKNYSISLPYKTSYLVPVVHLAHASPFPEEEPNHKYLKSNNCPSDEGSRHIIAVVYKVE